MRAWISISGAAAMLLTLAACTGAQARGTNSGVPASAASPPATARPVVPAAEAGGACKLLDFETIYVALDVRFDVAASASSGKTESCLVRGSDSELPDLTLTLSPTSADADVFREQLPDEARPVKELGTAAYRATTEPTAQDGPIAEVGWLSGDDRIITLRYNLEPGAPRLAADWMTNGLVKLAEAIEGARK